MSRTYRPIIAVNEVTGETRKFSGLYDAGKNIGAGHVQVLYGVLCGQAVKGWKVYDAPEKICERIVELKKQLEMLNGMGF